MSDLAFPLPTGDPSVLPAGAKLDRVFDGGCRIIEGPAVFFGHSPLQIAATVLLPAAIAALVYALMAVSTQRDDLDAWPPVEEPAIDAPVTADDALPSAQ